MTKVCHVTCVHGKEDVRIFLKECCSLAQAGYDVWLVQQGESYDKRGVHVAGFGAIAPNRLRRMLQTAKQAYKKALEVDADLYHLHDPELLPYALKLKRRGKKVIFDSHERYTEQLKEKPYLPSWCLGLVAGAYGWYERYVLSKIDAVIFPCTMGGINPFEKVCARSAIISNAAILDELFTQIDTTAEKCRNQICYIGGLTYARGITYLIQAAHKADARLSLAGAFSPKEYEQELRAMEAFSSVDFRGLLDRTEVAKLLKQSVAGICTLLNEGQYYKIDTFGIKVFEYLSVGLPVILSDSPYNKAMVSQYQFGICVDPTNVEQISQAIRYLLDHPEQARQMGENGRKAVEQVFNWNTEEKKLFALYEDIVKTEENGK